MKRRYLIDNSTADSGRRWREVEVDDADVEIRHEYGQDHKYFNGYWLHEFDLDDPYFYYRFTGQIFWLPNQDKK